MSRPLSASASSLLLLLAASAVAQPSVQFRPDAATFQYSEDESLVEVYLSIQAATVPFARADDGFMATLPTRFQLRPASQSAPAGALVEPVYDETYGYRYAAPDTAAIQPGQVFVEQLRLLAPPGDYELEVTVAPEGGSAVSAILDVTLPDYAGNAGTAISGIQLATAIAQAGPDDPNAKSGLAIRPNPEAYFGGRGVPVQYYAEVYEPPSQGGEYTLLAFLAESASGAAMPGLERRTQRPAGEVDIAVGRIDVSEVPSGIYYLRLVALDEANQAVAEQSKRLFIINPDVVVEDNTLGAMTHEESIFAAMGEEELALNLAHARVIATGRERGQIDDLATDEMRRQFLTTFWTNRDQDGIPSVNTARREFYERLLVVNDRFGEPGGTPGFQTQRGRVYLTYGPPAELDRRPFDTQFNPHEVWTYENIPGEGRSVFVFVDRYNASQFELVHSDVLGEVSVTNWQAEVMR